MRDLLVRCMKNRHIAEIIYIDSNEKITKRSVFIKNICGDKVIGFCTLRKQLRSFKINNILAVNPKVKRTAV